MATPLQPEEPVPYGYPYSEHPPPAPPPTPPAGYWQPAPRRTVPSSRAKLSVLFGVVGLFLPYVGAVLGIAAVVTGHQARKEIRTGPYRGYNTAALGLVLGYVTLLGQLVMLLR
ncbi:DUF4190 domain-containing protein [Nonomuraea gerenzanensis]|uniref:DUF4190 domain-containing protein n=1 Tax=Nonomuraea gerenzanensis TaxID=93944 RepID=UPI001CDA46C6|nr:DUF4190 domain-containing protein [Nonomuraea gerenzanensis]UBU12936.1 DUF4190 domain-containing protein [Nonomuraea gerenzanensis]